MNEGRTPRPDGPDDRGRERSTDAFVTDAAAFFDEVKNPLVGALTIRTGDRLIAEDLAQEAIARAWADWSRVSAMSNPRGWVFRVGLNLAASHWRRAASRRRAERADEHDRTTVVERGPELLAVEDLAVRAALQQLSRRQQEVVILRYYVRLDVNETAEALGIAPGTVKTQSHRALAKLRAVLGDDDDA